MEVLPWGESGGRESWWKMTPSRGAKITRMRLNRRIGEEEKRIEDEDEVCFLRAKRVLLGSGLTQLRTRF